MDRETLRQTFDSVSERYHRARPDYPDALFEHLLQVTGVGADDRLLEVGCGTGKATLPLARRGLDIVALEPGPALAAVARQHLAPWPRVRVEESTFEVWRARERVDLVFAATAWHWVDPKVRYHLAWQALKSSRYLAFWSATHVFPEGGDPFFHDIQVIYEEIGDKQALAGVTYPRPGELPDMRSEMVAGGLFECIDIRHFDWEVTYDADQYIELLKTFSGHITMQPWQRDRLFGEIRRRLALRSPPTLRRHWGVVLHIGRRA
jgi:SAM-dependent methyltransferase